MSNIHSVCLIIMERSDYHKKRHHYSICNIFNNGGGYFLIYNIFDVRAIYYRKDKSICDNRKL